MNANQMIQIIPTLKVNNRKLNEKFYIETLGMKPLLEESAFLSLGDQSGVEKLILEEAPSMRTRRVEGLKKLARLLIKVENPSEIGLFSIRWSPFLACLKEAVVMLLRLFLLNRM